VAPKRPNLMQMERTCGAHLIRVAKPTKSDRVGHTPDFRPNACCQGPHSAPNPAGRRPGAAWSAGRPPAPPRGRPAGDGARLTRPTARPSDGPRRTSSAPLAPRAGSRVERSSPKMRVFVPSGEERASVCTFIVVFEDECSPELQTPSPGGASVDIPRRRRTPAARMGSLLFQMGRLKVLNWDGAEGARAIAGGRGTRQRSWRGTFHRGGIRFLLASVGGWTPRRSSLLRPALGRPPAPRARSPVSTRPPKDFP